MQSQASEITIYDQPEPCPYLAGKVARLPLKMQQRKLSPPEFDERLAQGERRTGPFMYGTRCPACQACEPIRLAVADFRPTRTQERVWNRGQSRLRAVVQAPRADSARIALFNRHRRERDLAHERDDTTSDGYRQFLVESCCDTAEVAYYLEERLVMIAIVDRGAAALSAVYTYFEPAPDVARLSPGVFSILYELELCRLWEKSHLYLGFYVAGSPHMEYKATYHPHERLIQGAWRKFER
jgi:arginine-tRNA-protein transferase